MDYKELLCELLSCGYGDIEMLFKINYDFEDIKKTLYDMDYSIIDFESLLYGAIYLYRYNIQGVIDEKIRNEENGYEELGKLDAWEDIECFVNYLDTHIYIRNDEIKEIYRKYLSDEISKENDLIGFVELELGGDE